MQKKMTLQATTKKQIKSWVLLFAILIIVYASLYSLFNFVPYFKNKQHFVVISDSMEPIIYVRDLIIINKAYKEEDLVPETIIAFYEDLNNDGKNEIVVHYIAQVNTDEFNQTTYKTRRYDVQSYVDWDDWELTTDDIVGVYILNLKKFGSVLLFLESPFGKFIILIDILVIFWVIKIFTEDDDANKQEKKLNKIRKLRKIKPIK